MKDGRSTITMIVDSAPLYVLCRARFMPCLGGWRSRASVTLLSRIPKYRQHSVEEVRERLWVFGNQWKVYKLALALLHVCLLCYHGIDGMRSGEASKCFDLEEIGTANDDDLQWHKATNLVNMYWNVDEIDAARLQLRRCSWIHDERRLDCVGRNPYRSRATEASGA